jgi:hypothetical protein
MYTKLKFQIWKTLVLDSENQSQRNHQTEVGGNLCNNTICKGGMDHHHFKVFDSFPNSAQVYLIAMGIHCELNTNLCKQVNTI